MGATERVEDVTGELLFATPIFRRTVPNHEDLNRHLRELFLAREREEKAAEGSYSNVGGWHSPIELQTWRDLKLHAVLAHADALAMEATERLLGEGERRHRYRYSLSAWANVSREGDYNVPHVHMSTWSAVYYVSVPPGCEDGASVLGTLELLDPRPATAMVGMPGRFFATRHVIRPTAGLMVLFPASIMHMVHPFRGPGERVSIACDLTIELD